MAGINYLISHRELYDTLLSHWPSGLGANQNKFASLTLDTLF